MPRKKKSELKPKRGSVMFIRDMPVSLMRAFRAWCVLRGITQKSKLIQLMSECVKDTQSKE